MSFIKESGGGLDVSVDDRTQPVRELLLGILIVVLHPSVSCVVNNCTIQKMNLPLFLDIFPVMCAVIVNRG